MSFRFSHATRLAMSVMCFQIDVFAQQMRAISQAGQRLGIDLMAMGLENVGDPAPAPTAVIGAMNQDKGPGGSRLCHRRRCGRACRHAQSGATRDRTVCHTISLFQAMMSGNSPLLISVISSFS